MSYDMQPDEMGLWLRTEMMWRIMVRIIEAHQGLDTPHLLQYFNDDRSIHYDQFRQLNVLSLLKHLVDDGEDHGDSIWVWLNKQKFGTVIIYTQSTDTWMTMDKSESIITIGEQMKYKLEGQ